MKSNKEPIWRKNSLKPFLNFHPVVAADIVGSAVGSVGVAGVAAPILNPAVPNLTAVRLSSDSTQRTLADIEEIAFDVARRLALGCRLDVI